MAGKHRDYSRRYVVSGLIGVAATVLGAGVTAAKQGGNGKNNGKQKGKTKVTLCHKPGPGQQTLVVGEPAVKAHLGHGDYLGACETL